MNDWVRQSLGSEESDVLIQMDIGGHEYAALLTTNKSIIKRFRIFVCEFQALDWLFSEPMSKVIKSIFNKILQTKYCAHIHPNSMSYLAGLLGIKVPSSMEFIFHRKDQKIKNKSAKLEFPHPLNCPNVGNK